MRGRVAAAALALAALGCGWQRPAERAYRFGEGRFSVPSEYQTVVDHRLPPSAASLRQAAEWRRAALNDPSSVNLRRLGVAHATVANLDDGIRILEELTATGDGGAAAWSDLAAAYLTRSRARNDDLADVFHALDKAATAVHRDQNSGPAWFNLAIAQGAVGLKSFALTSWERFLQIETDAGWRAEAGSRIDKIRESSVREWSAGDSLDVSSAFLARRWLMETAFPELAQKPASRDQVIAVARQLSEITHDTLWIAAAGEAANGGVPAAAMALLAESFRAWRRDDFPKRRTLVLDACRKFREAASVLTPFCLIEQSTVESLSLDYMAALETARTATRQAEVSGHRFVSARGLATQAMVHTSIGEFAEAAKLFSASTIRLRDVGASPELVLIETTFADLCNLLGRQEEGWRRRQAALRLAAEVSDTAVVNTVFSSATVFSFNTGLVQAARQFAAMPEGDLPPLAQVAKLQRLARAEAAVGNLLAARDRLIETRNLIAQSTDPRARTIEADVDVAEGLLLAAEGRPDAAIDLLNTGVSRMGIVRQRQRTDALVWISRLETRSGRLNEARTHLEDAANRVRARLSAQNAPGSLVDERGWLWNAASELILAGHGSDPTRDIRLLEDIKNAWSPRPLRDDLPGSGQTAALLYFVVGEKSIGGWVRRGGAYRFRLIDNTPTELAHDLSRLRLQYRSELHAAGTAQTLRRLYGAILAPFESDLDGVTALHIVPDALLFGIPFAGLQDPGGRFLIHRMELTFSFTLASTTGHASTPFGQALLVGNPATTEAGALPSARREVSDIAAIYGPAQASLLVDAAATEYAFRAELQSASVVHFAGHAVTEPRTPERSRLLLAASGLAPELDGALSVGEIRALKLPKRPVVVLAACRTAGAMEDRRFGVGHLASELLRAGSSGVIATVDDIPDHTWPLYVALHRRLAAGIRASTALREAQIELSNSASPIDSWALAVFYGSPAAQGGAN